MHTSEVVSQQYLLLVGVCIDRLGVSLLGNSACKDNLAHLGHAGNSIQLLVSSGRHFLEVSFVLGGLLPLFNDCNLVEDWLHDHLVQTLVDEPVGLWQLVQVHIGVAHALPVVLGCYRPSLLG